ncbi:ribosomal protein S18-alanine N-acetyltransferase [Bdellovibrionota bacterium FG-2]
MKFARGANLCEEEFMPHPISQQIEGWSLRPVVPEDFPQILEIENVSQAAPWTLAHFQAELAKPHGHFLVLTDDETDERVAGYIVFWTLLEDAQILTVAVAPDCRRHGFARLMMRQALNGALRQGCTQMLLDVRKSNKSAIALYDSLGFTVTRIIKDAYTRGGSLNFVGKEDGYQMTLPLSGERVEF